MIDSLKTLQTKRTALKREINGKEADLHKIWDDLFHKKEENLMSSLSPTKRIVVIDGMLLGWKLYNRFGRKRR